MTGFKSLKEQIMYTILTIIGASLIVGFISSIDWQPYSSSGSIQALKELGELTLTDTHLYYVSNDDMYSVKELNALKTLSKHYVIKLEN